MSDFSVETYFVVEHETRRIMDELEKLRELHPILYPEAEYKLFIQRVRSLGYVIISYSYDSDETDRLLESLKGAGLLVLRRTKYDLAIVGDQEQKTLDICHYLLAEDKVKQLKKYIPDDYDSLIQKLNYPYGIVHKISPNEVGPNRILEFNFGTLNYQRAIKVYQEFLETKTAIEITSYFDAIDDVIRILSDYGVLSAKIALDHLIIVGNNIDILYRCFLVVESLRIMEKLRKKYNTV